MLMMRQTDARERAGAKLRSTTSEATRASVRDVSSTRGGASGVARDDDDDDDDDDGRNDDDDDDEDGAGGAFGAFGDARGCVEARGRRVETIRETRRRANARDAVHERII
jgi:hypothetical protein